MNSSVAAHAPDWLYQCFAAQQPAVAWLQDFQRQQQQAFLQRGLPTRREELWKYTDVSFLQKQIFLPATALTEKTVATAVKTHKLQNIDSILLVMINGQVAPEFSETQLLPKNIVLCSLQEAFRTHTDLIKSHMATNVERFPFGSLNAALMVDGVFLYIPNNQQVKMPIHLLYINATTTNFIACPRNLVIASENAGVTVLEEHCAIGAPHYFTNVVTTINAANNACVNYQKIQNESDKATHIAQIFVMQNQDSSVTIQTLALGSQFAREDISINLSGRGATCNVNGLYCLNRDAQHVDNHVQVDHLAPHCSSEMVYKGILDKKSCAVFNGKVLVHKEAQKTQSNLRNHNLLLAAVAEVNTQPELEIYADDVKCAHGDTVGQLDMAALFYLCSRGIEKAAALKMLTSAFAAEVLNKITCGAVRQKMHTLLNEKLSHDD